MRVLMISTDDAAFSPASDTRLRFESYAKALGEARFVVVGRESRETVPLKNGSIISAEGKWRIAALFRAYRIGAAMKGIEIVSSQDPFEQGFIAWLIAKRIGAKLHIQIHTDIGSTYFKTGAKNKIRVLLAKFILPRADAIRAVSERVKTAAVREYGAPLHLVSVLPIGIGTLSSVCGTTDGMDELMLGFSQPYILVISRLSREKNLSLAMRAFSHTAKNNESLKLIIVGEGPEKRQLSELSVSLGIDKRIEFVGFRRGIGIYFRSAAAYLLTSDYEGYGRTLIEAAAAGCPIVTTDVGLVGSILTKESALICPPRNEKCLAGHLSLLLENPKLGAHLAAAAKKVVTPIISESWGAYCARYRDDIARALQS